MSKHVLVISTPATVNEVSSTLALPSVINDGQKAFRNWKRVMDKIALGSYQSNRDHQILIGAVAATATLTFTGAPVNNETFTLNGVVFTAKTAGAVANEFNIGGSVTITAANVAASVEASVTAGVANVVTATSAAGVVTFTADTPGLSGNLFTLTEALTNATAVNFAGGAVTTVGALFGL